MQIQSKHDIVTYYNDVLCIEAKWLIEEGEIISYDNLKKRRRRYNEFKIERYGGNGRNSLINYSSIPDRYKEKIINKIGDPRNAVKYRQFRKHLLHDAKAVSYYANYKLQNGRALPVERQKEYYTNAMFINALNVVSKDVKARRNAMGGSKKGIWQALSNIVNDLQKEYGHSLPANYLRLKDKVKKFNTHGYSALIHRNYGNQNSRKLNELLERLILSIYIMNNKPYVSMVLDIYLEFLSGKIDIIDISTGEIFQMSDFYDENKGQYIIVSEATVWNCINDPKNRPIVDSKRNDQHYFNNLHRPHHHRKLPEFSLSKISFDDRDLSRKMKDAKGKTARVKAYYVYDVTSGALIGYAHSKKKDADLFTSCLRNMFRFLHKNNLGIPMEAEVEHHLVNQYEDDMMKAGVLFPFVRFCNPGNSQEKRSEHFIRVKKYGYEKRYQDGIGRYTLSEANRPKQDKEWNADGMAVKEKYYDYEKLVADDIFTINAYNNDLHPNQNKYPKMSRLDVLKMHLNPDLPKFKDELIARYIGEKTETSIRRNQYVRVQYEKYQLPNLNVLSRLKPNNYKVEAYYIPEDNGNINKIHLYQSENFIGTCEKIIAYNEATAEQTDADRKAYTEQAKYVSQFDKMIKEGRKKLSKIKIIENDFTEPEELTPKIVKETVSKDDFDFENEFEYNEFAEEQAIEDL